MTKTEIEELSRLLTEVRAVYDKPAPTAAAVEIWYKALKDFDFGKVRNALTKYPSFGKFAPKPADIVSILTGKDNLQDGPHTDWACKVCGKPSSVIVETKALCPEHVPWAHRAKPMEPFSGSDVMVARRMSERDARSIYGDRMVEYLAAHPESETHPAWAQP